MILLYELAVCGMNRYHTLSTDFTTTPSRFWYHVSLSTERRESILITCTLCKEGLNILPFAHRLPRGYLPDFDDFIGGLGQGGRRKQDGVTVTLAILTKSRGHCQRTPGRSGLPNQWSCPVPGPEQGLAPNLVYWSIVQIWKEYVDCLSAMSPSQFLPKIAKLRLSSLENDHRTPTSNVMTAPTHTYSGRHTVRLRRLPDETESSPRLMDTLDVAETSELTTPNYRKLPSTKIIIQAWDPYHRNP